MCAKNSRGDKLSAYELTEARRIVAHNLRAARRKASMTQMDLCEATGVSQQHISQIEQGRASVTVDTLYELARGLNVNFATLLRVPKA